MPIRPSPRMQALAARHHTDTVQVFTSEVSPDVDPVTLEPVTVNREVWSGAALVRQQLATLSQGEARTTAAADLTVKLAASNTAVAAGMYCKITGCDDTTLIDQIGTVVDVERDSLRAVRRFTIRVVPVTLEGVGGVILPPSAQGAVLLAPPGQEVTA